MSLTAIMRRAKLAFVPHGFRSTFSDWTAERTRVMQLRAQGERIDTHWQVIQTEAGVKHRVGVYTLQPGTDTKP